MIQATCRAKRSCPRHCVRALAGALGVAMAVAAWSSDAAATLDGFGHSVDIDGNNVLISASQDDTNGTDIGQVHLFDATTGALLRTFDDPTITTTDRFGFSVAIDGNNVLIGARNDDTFGTNVGQAYLFTQATAVPEPSTLALMLVGLLGLGIVMRQRA